MGPCPGRYRRPFAVARARLAAGRRPRGPRHGRGPGPSASAPDRRWGARIKELVFRQTARMRERVGDNRRRAPRSSNPTTQYAYSICPGLESRFACTAVHHGPWGRCGGADRSERCAALARERVQLDEELGRLIRSVAPEGRTRLRTSWRTSGSRSVRNPQLPSPGTCNASLVCPRSIASAARRARRSLGATPLASAPCGRPSPTRTPVSEMARAICRGGGPLATRAGPGTRTR